LNTASNSTISFDHLIFSGNIKTLDGLCTGGKERDDVWETFGKKLVK
jgi:hypothetical protein